MVFVINVSDLCFGFKIFIDNIYFIAYFVKNLLYGCNSI